MSSDQTVGLGWVGLGFGSLSKKRTLDRTRVHYINIPLFITCRRISLLMYHRINRSECLGSIRPYAHNYELQVIIGSPTGCVHTEHTTGKKKLI